MPSAPARIDIPVSPEQEAELAQARRRLRRNGVVIILVLDALIAAVGVAGSADLRTMRTPQGTAAAWADAAATGDCDRYLDLESPARRSAELAAVASKAQSRGVTQRTQLCTEVAAAWDGYSTGQATVVSQTNARATVRLTADPGLPTGDGTLPPPVTGTLSMVRLGGRWHVDTATGGCPAPALTPAYALCHTGS